MIELVINRLQKSVLVDVPISTLATGMTGSLSVRVDATVEGVTNTVYSATVSEPYSDTSVTVNGFDSAKVSIYINGNLVSEKTVNF